MDIQIYTGIKGGLKQAIAIPKDKAPPTQGITTVPKRSRPFGKDAPEKVKAARMAMKGGTSQERQ